MTNAEQSISSEGAPRQGPVRRARRSGSGTRKDLARQAGRFPRPHQCWDHLQIAAPVVAQCTVGPTSGTLLRTCDAVGACLWPCLASPWVPEALARGNTLRPRPAVLGARADGKSAPRAWNCSMWPSRSR